MRLGLFENFYPQKDRLGTHSTSLALLLQRADPTLELDLAVPKASVLPATFRADRVRFHPEWVHGNARSLIRSARSLAARIDPEGAILFNWFPTCFGENRSANAAGMSLPAFVRMRSRTVPFVYAHNFIETQDIGRLGYRPSVVERIGLGGFERLLTRSSRVIVPLESQRRSVSRLFGGSVVSRPLPFTEAIYGHFVRELEGGAVAAPPSPRRESYRILLFGVWGPAKDLDSVLPVLEGMYSRGERFETVFAGSFNRFFPEFRARFEASLKRLPSAFCRFIENPPDESTPDLFGAADLVILPYHAIAGPSGVMGLAAFHNCSIVAYDVPELREYDQVLEGRATFVRPGSADQLEAAISRGIAGKLPRSTESAESKVRRAVDATRRLLSYMAG
jgi:hypothetical protein